MTPTPESVQRQLRAEARAAREKAQKAATPAVAEYHAGRAAGLQAAADALEKLAYDPSDNPYDPSNH